jgi:methionyl-tRNA synthetase
MTSRKILVTAALPYASGHIHLGHLVEYIQTDIWVRFQKLHGNQCIYICADDTHGTGITLLARQRGISEEALIADMREHHIRDFAGFDIEFDNYGTTHSTENRALCGEIWSALRRGGYVSERDVTQLYDPVAGTFLADRFIKGTCPYCKSPDQYGDSCEICNRTFNSTDLIDPVSTLSGAKPELRTAKHLFVAIERLHEFLADWTEADDHLQPEVVNYLKGHFLNEPLRDWDVSRPMPYFGFEIPDSPGNCWYVWFDAPIGYMASTRQWCEKHGERFENWWPRVPQNPSPPAPLPHGERGEVEIHHFIGKDITYFHTLFWPAMLRASGFQLPRKIHIHGHLTVGGAKMSKRTGTHVRGATYLKRLNPAYLRYYYASKLTGHVDDLDLNLEEFVAKVNSDVVGKVVNLASRTARFVESTGLSQKYPDDGGLFAEAAAAGESIAADYEACEYSRAMRTVMGLADRANQFVDARQPWTMRKEPSKAAEVQDVCTVTLNLFRQLMVYLAPVLPRLAEQTGRLFGQPIAHWSDAQTPLVGSPVAPFETLLTRVDAKEVQAMIEDSKEANPSLPTPLPQGERGESVGQAFQPDSPDTAAASSIAATVDGPEPLAAEPLQPECTHDDFTKVDLRVARVVAAEELPKAKKLLKLTLSLGGDNHRTVFAGIKSAYKPEDLIGRLVICVANLAPRQMQFGVSEGMVVAAGAGGQEIFLLAPDTGAKPGHRVH